MKTERSECEKRKRKKDKKWKTKKSECEKRPRKKIWKMKHEVKNERKYIKKSVITRK